MLDGNSQAFLGDSQPGFSASPTSNVHFQSRQRQPFCGDIEGWGPLSPFRFDLTPCFLDFVVSLVAAWGLFMGAGAIWFLLRKRIPQPVSKDWHFYTKLVSELTSRSRCSPLTDYGFRLGHPLRVDRRDRPSGRSPDRNLP